METLETKAAFISYSWTTEKHEDWVLQLANRLMQDGVDVKLDKWHLKEGQDKFAFMESMVTSDDIHKVLIILDKKYAEKADARLGGVGTETMIITPTVYSDAHQEKFVPIIAEVDDNGQPYLPSYLSGRVFIDLSTTENLENNYEKLLRNIYNRPSIARPKLGKPPKYLTEDTPMQFKTTTIVRGFDAQIDRNPNRINSILQDFTDEFFNNLTQFVLSDDVEATDKAAGEAVLSTLHQYEPLKNDYTQILDKAIKSGLNFEIGILCTLLERLPTLLHPLDKNTSSWQPFRYNHFKLIIHELFLYTIAIGLKNNNYAFLEELLYQRYIIAEGPNSSDEPQSFTCFRYNYDTIDNYYKLLTNKNFYSVHAELIISHTNGIISKELLVAADMLCHFIAKLNNDSWFPITYIYENSSSKQFSIFTRLVSRRHFEKIKNLLGVDSMEELKQKINDIDVQRKERGYNSGFGRSILQFKSYIDVEFIGTAR